MPGIGGGKMIRQRSQTFRRRFWSTQICEGLIFEMPTLRLLETIRILAGLSRFIVADITNPKSAPLELQAIVPDCMIPLVPILQEGEQPFSMIKDLQQYDWVMAIRTYRSVEQLVENLEEKIIHPALKLHAELQLKKAQDLMIVPL